MIPASHIKKTIDFNARFKGLLEVLKLIAVSQYHILERKFKSFEEFQTLLSDFFSSIPTENIHHPFLDPGDKPLGVVAITSDAGLLGGMNAQVMGKALDFVRQSGGRLVVVGEKGQTYAQDARIPFSSFSGVLDNERQAQAMELRDFLTQKVLSGEMGPVKVVYPKALSFVLHRVEVATLIPFTGDDKTVAAGVPDKDVVFESRPTQVLEYLVYLLIGQRLYDIFGMSRLAEQAARFTHLEESCHKIQEMNQKLLLQYFRRRHEMIDAQMRELFAARSLYAK